MTLDSYLWIDKNDFGISQPPSGSPGTQCSPLGHCRYCLVRRWGSSASPQRVSGSVSESWPTGWVTRRGHQRLREGHRSLTTTPRGVPALGLCAAAASPGSHALSEPAPPRRRLLVEATHRLVSAASTSLEGRACPGPTRRSSGGGVSGSGRGSSPAEAVHQLGDVHQHELPAAVRSV